MTDDERDGEGTPTVRTRRIPAGPWPRHIKMWAMGAAACLFLIVVWLGGPKPVATPRPGATEAAQEPPSPEAIRSLQQRLDQAVRNIPQPQPAATPDAEMRPVVSNGGGSSARFSGRGVVDDHSDGVDARQERQRADRDSLRASNVVQSTTMPVETSRQQTGSRQGSGGPGLGASPSPPSQAAEIAALLRAMQAAQAPPRPAGAATEGPPSDSATASAVAPGPSTHQTAAPPAAVQATDGPLYPLYEGRIIETVLVTRINGSAAAPVTVLVTAPVYAADHSTVLIPVGATILGRSTPVQANGQSRLAVTFHRLLLPTGRSFVLDAPALSRLGEAGLKDKVDNHIWSVIGASAAVGVVSGLSQLFTSGITSAANGGTVIISGGTGGVAQATSQVMSHYLNQLPTVVIREGTGVRVYITADQHMPAYRRTS